jgi:SRSO17 transposase
MSVDKDRRLLGRILRLSTLAGLCPPASRQLSPLSSEDEKAPTKYWFSTLPANVAFRQLVDTAKLRWRIERDYHEGEAGAASIITQRCASRPMDS